MLAEGIGSSAEAAILVDGKLDEPEWAQARRYDDFKVTEPFRLSAPDAGTSTQARMISTPDGIAVAFTVEQSAATPRVKPRLERDQGNAADIVNFMIDFDGDGRTAYSFTVGLSGSIQDEVISNENQVNLDWDTDWTSAVTESEAGWQVELLIPWSVAPMRGTDTPTRTVAVYFGRALGSNGEWQAFPAVTPARGRFVSGFERIEIPQYRKALFHYWPYLTARHDLIEGRAYYKGGVDAFWKPSPNFQLSATVNPDFGQVESDDLVINFDAVETFFGDKRPFFTENQSIFDLRTPDSGRLIHTRRIGGDADDGSGASDIDAAIKLNGSLGALGYGLLAASEDGEGGRDFYAARLQYPIRPGLNIGWLGTHTERPTLDRSAQVQAFDLSWKPNEALIINAQVLASFIDLRGVEVDDSGGWMRVNWTPSNSWSYELEATHFGSQLNFDDLGFQRRAGLNEVELTGVYIHRVEDPSARLRSSQWSTELQARSNDHGDRLPTYLLLGNNYRFRSGNRVNLYASLISAGWEDLISRDNGLWRSSGRYRAEAEFVSRRYGDWTFGASFTLPPLGLSATPARELALSANWYPSDAFNASFAFGPDRTRDWLVWEGGRNFGRYSRRGDSASLNLSWFPGLKHELRLKSEWLAIRADNGERYQLQPSGQMLATGQARPDFDINNFGLQLRYRYLLGPQSDIFLAYSRGGFRRQDRDEAGAADLFDDALGLRDSDQLLAKIRYRF
ncbi:DUF5916 domain-containing protein [Montanilutibacter psychrotolerans]|uniref:DUF5916 domain-containing protein n=1 Tax=Montanilutibacter psychrotolerans TaxID=1327343 RepID=A0A3M8SXY7_9GAMM|nr:DUF5916 domain-containing protein [Lysobacter psychrotolerans]RNF86241.1 hypothetical protein EER27_02120 [Lysobacter psychrotolerans]